MRPYGRSWVSLPLASLVGIGVLGEPLRGPGIRQATLSGGRGLVMSGKGCDGGRKGDARKSVPDGFYERWARATVAVARGGAGDTP
ncbi:hypothetical protein DB88DRAFT_162293 [Papiliotrema laurentii]|uniref:Uncharacterized protein n=1 Tax=Papiliotrema laurentii TaxID=5418 RepID=A0AAD9FUI9_PAPLA|nr:hypothetical protein DB88DRAFT_162293 [Papiliotrema laurentii]